MISCNDLSFSYSDEAFSLEIEKLSIDSAEKVALVGPSGSGKTTLLKLLSGILFPERGKIEIDSQMVTELSKTERSRFRIKNIGLVPQQFELLDYLTVRENILLPFRVSGSQSLNKEVEQNADVLMERVGIHQHRDRLPNQLSQGERQRTAICRGLVAQPKAIFADEPTGNLDPENQARIVDLLLEQANEIGSVVLMVTHEPSLLPQFDRALDILDLRRIINPAKSS